MGCSTVCHRLLFPLHIPGSLVFVSSEWPELRDQFSLAAVIIGSQGCMPKLEQVLRRAIHEGKVRNVHSMRTELGKISG